MNRRHPRFAVLTDAAIELLAETGMRGLTHRAVDARAGLPEGSTSVYFRTRKALIEAVVQRLADLEHADVEHSGLERGGLEHDSSAPAADPIDPLGPDQLDELAGQLAGVADRLLTVGRARTLARYACLLEATHHPELRDVLAHGVRFRIHARDILTRAGAPDAQRRGRLLVAFINGLIVDRLLGAGALSAPPPGSPESKDDLRAAIALALRAMMITPE